MRKQRFFTEEVPPGGAPAIHAYCARWEAIWLDPAQTVLYGVAVVHSRHVDVLDGHPTIAMLPSILDSKDVHQHLKDKGKEKHSDLLKQHGVPNNASMFQVAEFMAKKHKRPILRPPF